MFEDTMRIFLNEDEREIGRLIGPRRRERTKGYKKGNGSSATIKTAHNDIRGCWAEMAVAKAVNLYWEPGLIKSSIDVGGLIECRSGPADWARLFIKPQDKDLPTVLVLCDEEESGWFRLMGYMSGQFAKRDYPLEILKSRTGPGYVDPGHYVPIKDLWPMDKLITWVAYKRRLKELEPGMIALQTQGGTYHA